MNCSERMKAFTKQAQVILCGSWRRRSRGLLLLGAVLFLGAPLVVHWMSRVEASEYVPSDTTVDDFDKWELPLTVYRVPHNRAVNFSRDEAWEDFKARRQQVERVCRDRRIPHRGSINGVFLNEDKKLAYCFVPKAGCTFWKRVFGFLNRDTVNYNKVASPFDIPRLHIHTYAHGLGTPWEKSRFRVRDKLRFMFSRDPYSRLWSAYLDKFYLPDFWLLFGSQILRRRKPKPSAREIACGGNVTFSEFVSFSQINKEPHWTPVSMSCDPCIFKPEVLGKMETYTRDSMAVLDRVNLTWILEDVDNHQHMLLEVDMLVTYNFQVIHFKSKHLSMNKCISDPELAQRLWRTFQMNGYISDQIPYKPLEPFSQQEFKDAALAAANVSVSREFGGKEALQEQKRQSMEDAFRQLSKHTLKLLAVNYDLDFKMFGYSPRFLN